jgi:NADH-quinone oxidoreductase subunit F
MLNILERITNGEGEMKDIDLLEEIADLMKNASLCALGNTAPNPVITTIKYFREEYEEHIIKKNCPAKVCTALFKYNITDDCTGCGLCALKCPQKAITGEKKQLHNIDQGLCIKCGICFDTCNFNAIIKE